jgi:cysteinyl-tRNA synthetase
MSVPSEAAKPSSAQPEWYKPTPEAEEPVLKVYNSLTRSKVSRRDIVGSRGCWYAFVCAHRF